MENQEMLQFFKEELFISDLKSSSKDEVLEELAEKLCEPGMIKSSDLLLDVLKQRETLGSTGIGKGIAIPHCRSLAIDEVYVVAGLSKKGIHFKAVDGKKVHLFFLIVAPPQDSSNEYLPLLGKIVEIVRDAKIRKSLLKAEDFAAFYEHMGG